MSKVTWIDLTDLQAWSGHHTGIQRVVYQLADHYSERSDVKYFVYNEIHRAFVTTAFQKLASEDTGSAAVPNPTVKSRIKRRALLSAKSILHRSPDFIRQRLTTPETKERLRGYYHRTRRALVGLRRASQPNARGPLAEFSAGDMVLIMGKAWDYPTLMPDLALMRASVGFKIVHVLYDVLPSLHPQLFGPGLFQQYSKHMFEAVANSDGFVAISESSKRDLQNFCRRLLLPEPPIGVMRLGDDVTASKKPTSPLPDLDPREFVLCVGTLEVRKNHALLYSIYKLAKLKKISLPPLVIVGKPGWYTKDVIYQIENDPEVQDQITIIGGISDSQLAWLYQNCLYTVYPAIYEGWGLPIAESLANGKLCIPSGTSSMTEIAGELLDYFLPYDAQGGLDLMQKYLDSDKLAAKEREIRSQYKLTNWEQTYNQFDEFVSSV